MSVVDNLEWRDKLSASTIMATQRWPWIASAIYSLKPYEAKGLGTLGVTDDGIMLVDPAYVDTISVEELAAVLIHEVSHYLRGHGERCKAYNANPRLWNLAGDAEINDDLVGHWKLPSQPRPDMNSNGYVMPSSIPAVDGLCAEEYYALICKAEEERQKQKQEQKQEQKSQQEKKEQSQGSGAGGDADDKSDDGGGDEPSGEPSEDAGNEDGSGSGGGEESDSEGESEGSGSGSGSGAGNGAAGSGKGAGAGVGEDPNDCVAGGLCGSAGGQALPGEDEARKAVGGGRTEVERKSLQRQVAEAIREAAERGRGGVPGGWSRWADLELKPSKIPWQQKLSRACRAAVAKRMGAVNAGYHKPSRRQAGLGFGLGSAVLPAYFSPVPRVMMMLDTSGSMGTDEVSRGCSEGAQVIKALGCPITFGSIDTEVHALGKVRHYSEFASLVKGGGGTDFRDAFKLIESMPKHEKPEILIFATDGCGPAPSQPPPNLHVVWLLIGRYKQKPYASDDGGYANMGEITYGEFIEVDETE